MIVRSYVDAYVAEDLLSLTIENNFAEELILCLRWFATLEYSSIESKILKQAQQNASITCARLCKLDKSGGILEKVRELGGISLMASLAGKTLSG